MTIDVDYLVIGSGLAGLNAALRLAEGGGAVCVVTKRDVIDGATGNAQGGIASVTSEQDSFDAHVEDTLVAGAGLCHEDVVRAVVTDGPPTIRRLASLGVSFDKHGGDYDLTREGGHSARRILHSQDVTGREIARALASRIEQSGARVLTHHIAVDLVTLRKIGRPAQPDRCLGAYVLDDRTGQVVTIRAKATLLASGGAGKVYLYTTNPDVATGDGVAMAFRAGAAIANMEFVQFHPTCLFHPQAKNFLLSEALRGEGGVLRRPDGTPFMKEVHPLADLAPRDVVARAIDQELKRSGDDFVMLDMTAREPGFIRQRFPNLYEACMKFGIDMTRAPIPVVPAAHYCCGGVRAGLDGQSDLAGLFAAGETACTGLHGANRLASNSLLEAVVMSERAAEAMKRYAAELPAPVPLPEWDTGTAVDPDEMVVVSHNWDELRRAMWSYVGIVRSDKRLARAATRIRVLQEEIDDYYWDFKLTHDLVELRNLATVASLIVASAQRRRESRGLHHNIDVPAALDAWRRDTVVHRGPASGFVFEGGA